VRQHNQIGDMLCSLTLYKALKKKYPDSRITLVASKTNYGIPFFDINPFLDRVIVFDKSSIIKIIRFILDLRKRKYQIGIVPSTITLSRTSHIINFLSGAKIRVGVNSIDGIKNVSHKYLNIKSDFLWKQVHQIERNLQVVKQINCDLTESEILSIGITINDEDTNFAKKIIEQTFKVKQNKIFAFHPGAGKKANTWSSNNFAELIKKLYSEFNNYILLTSGWTDETIIAEISNDLSAANLDFKVMHNVEIKKLGAVLSLVDLYITNDTGTMHVAGYSGAKVISLFGPTNPVEWAPRGPGQEYIKSSSDEINNIMVDDVLRLAKKMISTK
jgi:ADP-heptose:LPS heptosyltransferase